MSDRWIENWTACDREIESWLDDDQMLAELGRRCVLSMLGSHPALRGSDTSVQLLLRRLLAADWLAPAVTCCDVPPAPVHCGGAEG